MTVFKQNDRTSWTYDFWFKGRRYKGKAPTERDARLAEDDLKLHLRLHSRGTITPEVLSQYRATCSKSSNALMARFDHRLSDARDILQRLDMFVSAPVVANALTGWVYFAGSDDLSPIKIGFATDVERRLTFLRTNNPRPINVLALIPGTMPVESFVHELFDIFRIGRSEWFHRADLLVAFLLLLKEREGGAASTVTPESEAFSPPCTSAIRCN